MNISLRVFGPLSDITGWNQQTLNGFFTTTELMDHLSATFPALRRHSFQVAVNGQLISADMRLTDQDEVALLPPFSGG